MVDTPPPGIYENIPFSDYLSWDAVSNSRISQAKQSLRHFKTQPAMTATKALRLGSLVHAGKLEPLSIPMLYAVMPDYHLDGINADSKGMKSKSRNTTYYRDKRDKFHAANADKTIVSQSEYNDMLAIVQSIAADQLASSLLNADGFVEISLLWEDAETGLMCKARIDKLSVLGEFCCDLKTFALMDTSRKASEAFGRTIVNRGYHRQMAHYCTGATELFGVDFVAAIVAVDKAAPYNVLSAPLGTELLEAGRDERRELLRKIADAYETDCWPGYDSPECWTLPGWYESTQEPVEFVVNGRKVTL